MRRLALPAALIAALVIPTAASATLPVPIPDTASPNAIAALERNLDRFAALPVPTPEPARGKGRLTAILVLQNKLAIE